jgi:hypothetical protein
VVDHLGRETAFGAAGEVEVHGVFAEPASSEGAMEIAGTGLGAFLILSRFHEKTTVLYVVLGCGVIGAALQLTVA